MDIISLLDQIAKHPIVALLSSLVPIGIKVLRAWKPTAAPKPVLATPADIMIKSNNPREPKDYRRTMYYQIVMALANLGGVFLLMVLYESMISESKVVPESTMVIIVSCGGVLFLYRLVRSIRFFFKGQVFNV